MTQPRRTSRKVEKALLFGSALVLAILVVAHFAWKYSGSNKWELIQEKNGVKVYALKVPGATREQFKAVGRIKTTLNQVVATMTDTSADACKQFVPGCVGGQILKPWDSQSLNVIQAFRVDLPRTPFSSREYVIKTQFSRDPQSKWLMVECTALPGVIPPNACCVRVTDMHNSWRFTPLENGELELEFLQNADIGAPYWLYNRITRASLSRLPAHAERVFNKEKYAHAEFAWLKER